MPAKAKRTKGLKVTKVLSLDGIPNMVLKVTIVAIPGMFRTAIQKCLTDSYFPNDWEIQKMMLLPTHASRNDWHTPEENHPEQAGVVHGN